MRRIFLVEDDEAIAKNLVLLPRSEEFTVTYASAHGEALAALAEHKFDLALIDISLPGGNGFTVYTEIRETLDTPVIFLTASDDKPSVVTGLNMGADDYITKPFRPRKLIARVRTTLRKSGYSLSAFEISGLHVGVAGGVVKKSENEVFLSALEYQLFLVFINNSKSIITRSRLLDELWGAAGEFVSNNTLTVYIKRLREKIGNNPTNPQMILTVRGAGYQLGDGRVSK